ncbi:MAG: MASE3 domain-containing protein [Solirubrobacterales bacterium]
MLILVLLALAAYSFIVFHTVAELFAVIVAFTAFGLAWYSRPWIGSNFLLMLGIGHLFVAVLDLAHILAYKGMEIIPASGVNMGAQFWIAGRLMEAVAFSIALTRPLAAFPPGKAIAGFFSATILACGLIVTGAAPDMYVEGSGLTPLKISLEYGISLTYVALLALLIRRRDFDPRIREFLVVSLFAKVAAELAFTLYMDPFGVANFVGHVFKIVSYFMFLRAIVETGVVRPQALIFGSLEREKVLVDQIRRHAATLDAVLNASLDAVVMIDADGRFHVVSSAAEKVFGRTVQELNGRTWREAGLPDAAMAAIDAMRVRVLDSGQPQTTEYTVSAPGGIRCLEAQVSPMRSPEGEPSAVVVVIRDITARKVMEEELTSSLQDNRVLMTEVHHRVKNNLQIVSSILQMQGWRVSDPAVRGQFEEACGRILSLAMVHEMLYKQDNVSSIDFVGYVRSLCDELFRVYGIRNDWIDLKIADGSLPLALDKAVPLALIAHELVTDALKQGFSDQGGELRISMRQTGPDEGVLDVAEDGRAASSLDLDGPTAPLGMRMVAVLVKQIQGTISMSQGGPGLQVTIRFPLSHTPVLAEDEVTPAL